MDCLFCGRASRKLTREHAVPKWARDTFSMEGPITVSMGESGAPLERIHERRHFNIVLNDRVCAICNNGWLARLESEVKPLLGPMLVEQRTTKLAWTEQKLLATWAVKTSLLLEQAFAQRYERRPIPGYVASQAELAWLSRTDSPPEPPPRSQVWMSCVDAAGSVGLRYEPSEAPVPSRGGEILYGHLTSFALGYVAFQVFSIDFVKADLLGAVPSWPAIPDGLRASIHSIWPTKTTIVWPPPAIPSDEWHRLVTWDGALREPSPQPSGY